MRKPYSPNCLCFSMYLLECLWRPIYFVFFPDFFSILSKNCYKNDVATSNVKYRHSAQLMSGACRDLSSLHFSDLEVILFLCCQLEYSLWDAEHLWQAPFTWLELALCRISPLCAFLVKNSINNQMHKCWILVGKLFLLLLHLSHKKKGKGEALKSYQSSQFSFEHSWIVMNCVVVLWCKQKPFRDITVIKFLGERSWRGTQYSFLCASAGHNCKFDFIQWVHERAERKMWH